MRKEYSKNKLVHTNARRLISRIKKYIRANFKNDLSQSTVAGQFNISKATLRNYFLQFEGRTYHDYVETMRIRYAHHLLLKNGRLIKQVMHLAGYKNRSTFIKIYRKHFGEPPSRL